MAGSKVKVTIDTVRENGERHVAEYVGDFGIVAVSDGWGSGFVSHAVRFGKKPAEFAGVAVVLSWILSRYPTEVFDRIVAAAQDIELGSTPNSFEPRGLIPDDSEPRF